MKAAFLFSVHVGRRRVLHAARDILAAAGLSACAPRIGLPLAHDDGRFIDAHCHVFNASDLPVSGFLRSCILDLDESTFGYPIGLVLEILVAMLKQAVPDGAAESAAIDSGDRDPAADGRDREADVRTVEQALAATLTPGPAPAGEPSDRPADPGDPLARTAGPEAVASMTLMIRRALARAAPGGPMAAPPAVDPVPPLTGDELRAFAESLVATPREGAAPPSDAPRDEADGPLRRWVNWALLLRRYRSTLVNTFDRTYRRGPDGVALMTPAMIDYDHWVGDRTRTSQDGQVAVMTKLIRRQAAYGGVAIHPSVAFCPWRAAVDGGATFERVRRAVHEGGFIGVKLYPPMGFRALGNAALPRSAFPAAWGRDPALLDDALSRLYGTCEADGIPVLTHCSNSNYPRPGYGERAAPAFWGDALERFPRLRLCFAHFGGPWAIGRTAWMTDILALMHRFDGVYADVGDMSFVHGSRGVADGATPLQAALWRQFADALLAFDGTPGRAGLVWRRVMYGSDWVMQARERRSGLFLDRWRQAWRTLQPADLAEQRLDGFLRGNAAAFLGLRDGEATERRLSAFYGGDKPAALLRAAA